MISTKKLKISMMKWIYILIKKKEKKACTWFLDLFSSLPPLNIRMDTEDSANIYWPFGHLALR